MCFEHYVNSMLMRVRRARPQAQPLLEIVHLALVIPVSRAATRVWMPKYCRFWWAHPLGELGNVARLAVGCAYGYTHLAHMSSCC